MSIAISQRGPRMSPLTIMQLRAILAVVVRYVALSDQLRSAIEASGLSRADICRKIELDPGVMSRFMAGKCGLALKTIDRLGRLLGMQLECCRHGGRSK